MSLIVSFLSPHYLHLLFLLWHSPFSFVLCCYQERFSFFLEVSLSLLCLIFLVWDLACLSLEISIHLFFFDFLVILSGDTCIFRVVSGFSNQSFSALFLCNLLVVVSMHRRYFECWQVLFFLLLTHKVCLHHLCDVRPYASSWVSLFSCPLVRVLLWFTLRMVLCILRGG